jgi:hypothetical protein
MAKCIDLFVALNSQAIPPGTTPPSSFSRGSFAPALDMPRPGLKSAMAESETSENESSQSSDDDAPLSTLLPPRRPGSAMSGSRPSSPAVSARSARSIPNSPIATSSTPQNTHLRTSSAGAISTLEQAGHGRKTLVDLSVSIQKETGKPMHLQPPTASAGKKSSPLRSKRSFKGVGNGPTPSASSSSSSSTSPSTRSPVRQLASTNKTETTARGRASMVQAGQLPSAKIHSVPLKSAPEPEPASASASRFMVFRPFARTDSPPSSTGNSSATLPFTPQTGSDAGGSSVSGSRSGDQEHRNAKERRKASVSFVESELEKKGEKKVKGMHRREGSETHEDPAEDKRKERRRSEAMAAIEVRILQ